MHANASQPWFDWNDKTQLGLSAGVCNLQGITDGSGNTRRAVV